MIYNLSNKIAFVTGSSRGIGRKTAEMLACEGCTVYLNARDQSVLKNAVDEIKQISKNQNVFGIGGDITETVNIQKALNQIVAEQKRPPDLIVASVGSGRSKVGVAVDDAEWQRMFELNFFAAVRIVRESVTLMGNASDGRIVCISSIAGCEALPAPIPYSAAKTALLSFVKNTADAVAANGIRINAVSPGNVMFPGSTWDQKIQSDAEAVKNYIKKSVPLNQFASPEDIAHAVLFLLSDQAKFITGTNLVVDGGQTRKIL